MTDARDAKGRQVEPGCRVRVKDLETEWGILTGFGGLVQKVEPHAKYVWAVTVEELLTFNLHTVPIARVRVQQGPAGVRNSPTPRVLEHQHLKTAHRPQMLPRKRRLV